MRDPEIYAEISNFINVDEDIVISEYPTEHDVLQSVITCSEGTIATDESDNEGKIERLSMKEMLKTFDAVRRE